MATLGTVKEISNLSNSEMPIDILTRFGDSMDTLKPPGLVSGQYIYQPLSFKAVQRMYGDEEGSSFRCVSSEFPETFNPFESINNKLVVFEPSVIMMTLIRYRILRCLIWVNAVWINESGVCFDEIQ